MFWGILALAGFLLAAAKYVTHRLPEKRGDKLFLKLHLLAGTLLPTAACVHGVKALRGGGKKTPLLILTGALLGAGVAMLMFSHFFAKKLGKLAMPLHRWATVFTGACIPVHAVSALRR